MPATKVIGHRWNQRSWEVRQFLARNQHFFRAYMADEPKGKQLLDAAGLDGQQLPVVITEAGEPLVEPSDAQLAEMLGLSTSPSLELYDLAVIGGGPAGLAAAVYGASEGLNTVLIERTTTGGQAGRSSRIENYLGFETGVSGAALTTSARRQAERFGAEVITTQEAVKLELGGSARKILFGDGTIIGAQAVILATGCDYRQLPITGCRTIPEDPDEQLRRQGRVLRGVRVGRRRVPGRGRLHRRRGQLGRPGRDVHVEDGEERSRCWCGAPRWRRRCPTT